MAQSALRIQLELSSDLANLSLPEGVDRRLQFLLDRQEAGEALTEDEQAEAEGLVELSELLTLLRLRTSRPTSVPDGSASEG